MQALSRWWAALVLVCLTAACTGSGDTGSTAPVEGATLPSDALTVVLADGGEVTTEHTVALSVVGASVADLRWSLEPDLSDEPWHPAGDAAEVTFLDTGYQMVFVEARDATGNVQRVTGGIVVDPTWDAATSSADGGSQRASWGELAHPQVLVVRVEAGRIVEGALGNPDEIVGVPLDAARLDDASGYSIAGGPAITSVSRITRPNGLTEDAAGNGVAPLVHDLYLTLDAPLPLDTALTLSFPGGVVEPYELTIDPRRTESPAVHVNQVGFRPNDRAKTAYLSSWDGRQGVQYDDATAFEVVEVSSGEAVFEGTAQRREITSGDGEWGGGDLTGAPVWALDFSDLDRPGRYAVCVDAIGCSPSFAIDELSTWRRAAIVVARAAYHQRSGIALTQPFTSVERPRPFHPDDGRVVRRTTVTLMDDPDRVGLDDRFDEYVAAATDETVPDAWGGHFDAGDWNQNIRHLWFTRTTLDLVDLYPDVFAGLDLDIPESGDAVPDVLDEGLWDLDLFTRLQRDDGAISGGVDQARFGIDGETSWSNDIEVFALSPDPWSSYIYASVAATAAVVLAPYDQARADGYAETATKAMTWAESQVIGPEFADAIGSVRAAAAAAMLRLTSDAAWNDVFAEATTFDDGPLDLLSCHGRDICEAAWAYARVPEELTVAAMRDNVVESFRRNAETLIEAQSTTAYEWSIEHPFIPLVWGLGPSTAHGDGLLRAYVVTGDERFRDAAVRTASYALGGNPLGVTFVTGLGETNVRHPLIADTLQAGLSVWPGTAVFGTHDLDNGGEDDWVEPEVLAPLGVSPLPSASPKLTWWYDVPSLAMMNEFTMAKSHAVSLWTFGVLSAT